MSASRVLAIWCMDWPAVAAAVGGRSAPDVSGGGHAGQPGHRLLGVGPRGRGAPRPAPPGGPGQMPAAARRHRRPGARCPPLRRRDGRGGRPGAARRGAAARPAGVAGSRRGTLLRVRAGSGRAVGRCGGRGRSRMPGGNRRPAAHRGLRRTRRANHRTRQGCGVLVRAVHPAAGHRTEPGGARPRRPGGSVVAHGNSEHRAVRRVVPRRCGLPVRGRRGGRTSLRPRRTEPRAVGTRTATGARRRDGLRPADRPGGCRGVRRPVTGQRPASQPRVGGRRLHPAGHPCRDRQR